MKIDKKNIKFEPPVSALARHNPEIQAAAAENDKSVAINIYSTIGEYGDGSGMTAKIMSAILKKADGRDVTVNINSPGGDVFEGITLHSLLSEYEGTVNVKVLGLAASAASIVALAGDTVEIAKGGMFMIHNSWSFAMGNKNDMRDVAEMLDKIDKSMAKIYIDATGMDEKAVKKMMDDETWMSGDEAVAQNFAHTLLGDDETKTVPQEKHASAQRKIDVALAKAGMPRAERRELLKELNDTPRAVDNVTPRADELNNGLMGLLTILQK